MNSPNQCLPKSSPKQKGRTIHRIVVVGCGALALTGALMAWWVDPQWGWLAGLGGLGLVLCPETEAL